MNKKRILNQNGFSLIEILIASGIIAIVAMAMASMTSSQQKQMRLLEQKSETIDLKNTLAKLLYDPAICTTQLQNLPLTPDVALNFVNKDISSINTAVESTPIVAGPVAGVSSPLPNSKTGIKVDGLRLQNFVLIKPGVYRSIMEISFDKNSTIIALIPINLGLVLKVNMATNQIQSCESLDIKESHCNELGGTWDPATLECTPTFAVQGWVSPGLVRTSPTTISLKTLDAYPLTDAQIAAKCPAGTRVADSTEVLKEDANLSRYGTSLFKEVLKGAHTPFIVANFYKFGQPVVKGVPANTPFSLQMYTGTRNYIKSYDNLGAGSGSALLCVSTANPMPPNIDTYASSPL